MKNILNLLFLKHSTWIKYVKSFGCKEDLAEDYVQEMYIKIFLYSERKDNNLMFNENEINYFFIYVTLKNMFYDNLRKNKKVFLDDLKDDFIQDDIEYNEIDFNVKNNAIISWRTKLDLEIKSINEYNQIKANLLYIDFIYQKIFIENIPISKLSREVGITYWSLRNTVLIIKKNIKDEI